MNPLFFIRRILVSKIACLTLPCLFLCVVIATPCIGAGKPMIAQETTSKKKSKNTKKVKDFGNSRVSTDSKDAAPQIESESNAAQTTKSEDIRKTKKFEVDALFTPSSDFMLRYGASFAKSLSPNLRIGLTYLGGSKNKDFSEGTVKSTAVLTGMAVYGEGRFFVGNSFNVVSGIGYRSALIDAQISDSTFDVRPKITVQSIVVPLFLGNAWTWNSGFTLGVDWIGAFIPISGSAKSSLTGNLTSRDASALNDIILQDGQNLAKETSLTLLMTSLGWAF